MSFAETLSHMEEPVTGSGKRPMARPDQKAVAIMRQALYMFSKPGNMFVGPVIGPGAKSKACLLKPKHCKCTGCVSNRDCRRKMQLSLLETLAGQMQTKIPTSSSSKRRTTRDGFNLDLTRELSNVYSHACEGSVQITKKSFCNQAFPAHIFKFILHY